MSEYDGLLRGKRGLSREQLIQSGFPFDKYISEFASGFYTGILDMKAWGKSPCLHCYFTTDNGEKIRLTVYQNKDYSPSKCTLNMSESNVTIGCRFKLGVGKTKKGRTAWELAEIL